MCGSAWAWASWPRWRCATRPPAATWWCAPARPPVRPECLARRLQARRLPAQLRLHLCRAAVRPPDARADPARDGRRRCRTNPATPPCDDTHPAAPPPFQAACPQVGTTIFTVMSALAQEHGAVNLGQGFPDFDCDPALLDAVNAAMRAGHNQYPPMAGVPALREAVAAKIEALLRPALRPGQRDHRHRRRHAGDPHRDPGLRASGRRGRSCSSPATTAMARTSSWPAGRVVRVPLDAGQLSARLRRHRARAVTAHARDHRQQPAQPERHGLARRPTWTAWPTLLRPTDVLLDQRRGLRAHGLRRPAPRQRVGACRSWRRAPSSSRASARPSTSPAGRSAPWPRRRR